MTRLTAGLLARAKRWSASVGRAPGRRLGVARTFADPAGQR
ncbi:hypothetical protein ACWEFJ_32915 [Actinosynnema sp. NPDC004786]